MKKIGKLKLNQLSKDELDQRQMNGLKGGCECSTSCSATSCSGPYTGEPDYYVYSYNYNMENNPQYGAYDY